jgi:hypothetical protein
MGAEPRRAEAKRQREAKGTQRAQRPRPARPEAGHDQPRAACRQIVHSRRLDRPQEPHPDPDAECDGKERQEVAARAFQRVERTPCQGPQARHLAHASFPV